MAATAAWPAAARAAGTARHARRRQYVPAERLGFRTHVEEIGSPEWLLTFWK